MNVNYFYISDEYLNSLLRIYWVHLVCDGAVKYSKQLIKQFIMKKIFFLIFVLCFSTYSKGQDAQLFDNTWYLQQVVIDKKDIFPPINNELSSIPLNFDAANEELITTLCNSINAFCSFSSNENMFTTLGDWFIFGIQCTNSNNIDFQDLYYNTIWNLDSNEQFDLNYTIENDGDNKRLTITNSEDNKAIYGNVLLSTLNFEPITISIWPNPAQNQLHITSDNNGSYSAILFNSSGSQIMEVSDQKTIEIDHLASGIYFFEITMNDSKTIKKWVKK